MILRIAPHFVLPQSAQTLTIRPIGLRQYYHKSDYFKMSFITRKVLQSLI